MSGDSTLRKPNNQELSGTIGYEPGWVCSDWGSGDRWAPNHGA